MSFAQDMLVDEVATEVNPYILGSFGPVHTEVASSDLTVIGEIPADLHGVYYRNGPNSQLAPRGRYQWFDGDGMVHAVHFEDGTASYRNRYVRTNAFRQELAAQRPIWEGIRETRTNNPGHWWKDTANTDVVFFDNKLLALWYLSGDPYAMDPMTLETLGVEDFRGTRSCSLSAHAKIDEATDELFFFDYGNEAPYLRYGVVGPSGAVTHLVDIDLPGPRLPHDMAITENYSVLLDLPLVNDPAAFAAGRHKLVFHRDWPSRFAVIPRHGSSSDVRWFEADPCYFYHVVNAWEEGPADNREIVLDICRMEQPTPRQDVATSLDKLISLLQLEAHLYRYRFNLATGRTTEGYRDDANTEFPMVNLSMAGRKTRWSYNVRIADNPIQVFDGLVKYDLETGERQTHEFGPGRFGSEAPFASRPDPTSEDDGYVVSFVHDENTDRSEVVILDAQDFTAPPIGRVILPQRVPLGFHGTWARGDQLAK
jgi:carotenoid cleavage dioxygenase-like enzyme